MISRGLYAKFCRLPKHVAAHFYAWCFVVVLRDLKLAKTSRTYKLDQVKRKKNLRSKPSNVNLRLIIFGVFLGLACQKSYLLTQ